MSPPFSARWAGVLLPAALAAGAAACAHERPAAQGHHTESMEVDTMSGSASTTIEGDGVRVEAAFETVAGGGLRVRYRVRNTGDADIAVFDRGNRHAVLTRRQRTGEVGEPGFRDEGDGDVSALHVALPLPQPSPTVPPVPLAAKLPAGAGLEGEFEFAPLLADTPRRVRWCLGVAPFDEAHFGDPETVDGVEVWQGSFDLAGRQQTLCTGWFEIAAGAFAGD